MKELFRKMRELEKEIDGIEGKAESAIDREEFEEAKKYEEEADSRYEFLYELFDEATDKIVRMTRGKIDKVTAAKMVRCRREEVEKLFA